MSKKYINGYNWGSKIVLEYKENGVKKSDVITDFEWYLVISKIDYEKQKR